MNYAGWRLKTLDKFRNPGLPSSRPFRNSLDCSFSPQKLFLTSLSWTVSTRRRRRTSATGAPFARSVVAEKWGCGLEVGFLENEIPENPLSTWLHNAQPVEVAPNAREVRFEEVDLSPCGVGPRPSKSVLDLSRGNLLGTRPAMRTAIIGTRWTNEWYHHRQNSARGRQQRPRHRF